MPIPQAKRGKVQVDSTDMKKPGWKGSRNPSRTRNHKRMGKLVWVLTGERRTSKGGVGGKTIRRTLIAGEGDEQGNGGGKRRPGWGGGAVVGESGLAEHVLIGARAFVHTNRSGSGRCRPAGGGWVKISGWHGTYSSIKVSGHTRL